MAVTLVVETVFAPVNQSWASPDTVMAPSTVASESVTRQVSFAWIVMSPVMVPVRTKSVPVAEVS